MNHPSFKKRKMLPGSSSSAPEHEQSTDNLDGDNVDKDDPETGKDKDPSKQEEESKNEQSVEAKENDSGDQEDGGHHQEQEIDQERDDDDHHQPEEEEKPPVSAPATLKRDEEVKGEKPMEVIHGDSAFSESVENAKEKEHQQEDQQVENRGGAEGDSDEENKAIDKVIADLVPKTAYTFDPQDGEIFLAMFNHQLEYNFFPTPDQLYNFIKDRGGDIKISAEELSRNFTVLKGKYMQRLQEGMIEEEDIEDLDGGN